MEKTIASGLRPIAQGDVLLVPRKTVPKGRPEPVDTRHGVVLAYGEATGSAHALDPGTAEVISSDAGRTLVVGAAEAILRHLKHPPIVLPANTVWDVILQAEEVEGAAIRVAD